MGATLRHSGTIPSSPLCALCVPSVCLLCALLLFLSVSSTYPRTLPALANSHSHALPPPLCLSCAVLRPLQTEPFPGSCCSQRLRIPVPAKARPHNWRQGGGERDAKTRPGGSESAEAHCSASARCCHAV